MIIEKRPCPGCALRRTARTPDRRRICFNCRRVWRDDRPVDAVEPTRGAARQAVDGEGPDLAFAFSPREWARLAAYREAVRAGLFNEGLPPTGRADGQSAAERARPVIQTGPWPESPGGSR